MTKRRNKKVLLINILATLGYISCLLQWLWAVVLYIPLVKRSHILELLAPETKQQVTPVATHSGEPSILVIVIAVIITIIIIAITVYALLRIPTAIGRTGQRLTQTTAQKYVIPAVTHRQKLPVRKKRRLTLAAGFTLKALLLVVPLLFAAFAYTQSLTMPYDVIIAVALFLAGISAVCFAIELLLIALLQPPVDSVW